MTYKFFRSYIAGCFALKRLCNRMTNTIPVESKPALTMSEFSWKAGPFAAFKLIWYFWIAHKILPFCLLFTTPLRFPRFLFKPHFLIVQWPMTAGKMTLPVNYTFCIVDSAWLFFDWSKSEKHNTPDPNKAKAIDLFLSPDALLIAISRSLVWDAPSFKDVVLSLFFRRKLLNHFRYW